MKKVVLCLFILVASQSVLADIFSQKIQADKKRGLITETQAIFYEALRVFSPDKLPEQYRVKAISPVKCGFDLSFSIKRKWQEFDNEQKAILKPFISRPDLPYSYISPSGRFKIHYTTTGPDSVSSADMDHSGIPDYVEEAAEAMDHVYHVEVEKLGFKPPLADQNVDGPELDVYIKNTSGTYGWTMPEKIISQKPDIYACYIVLDNDYTHTPTKGINGLRVTAAHEFFHTIQLAYNGRDDNNDGEFDDLFMMEAGAVWMEDKVYNYINDYYYYLPGFFSANNIPFDEYDGSHEYGLCIWFHFLVKRFWEPEIVRNVWEEIVDYPAIKATDAALRNRNSTFADELSLFYGWNYMTGSRADTSRFYPEGDHYPEVHIYDSFKFGHDTTITTEIVPTAAKYFSFYQDDGTSFTLIPTNVNWNSEVSSNEISLNIVRSWGNPSYTDLGNGVQAAIVTNNNNLWKCVAVTEYPGGKTSFIPFETTNNGNVPEENLPASFPNPFVLKNQPVTTIPFVLNKPGIARITIFGTSGYKIKEEEEYCPKGLNYYKWDGKNKEMQEVAGGIYIYIVTSDNKIIRKNKIAVIR